MFSWFSETFCCSSLRLPDLFSQGTSPRSNPISKNVNNRAFTGRWGSESRDMPSAFSTYSEKRAKIRAKQPRPHPILPPFGGRPLELHRNKPLPPVNSGVGNGSDNKPSLGMKPTAGVKQSQIRVSSSATSGSRFADEQFGDIGLNLVSAYTSLPTSVVWFHRIIQYRRRVAHANHFVQSVLINSDVASPHTPYWRGKTPSTAGPVPTPEAPTTATFATGVAGLPRSPYLGIPSSPAAFLHSPSRVLAMHKNRSPNIAPRSPIRLTPKILSYWKTKITVRHPA